MWTECSTAAHRDQVAEPAVRRPLDDPRVRTRVGGAGSPPSVTRQAGFASAVVATKVEGDPPATVDFGSA